MSTHGLPSPVDTIVEAINAADTQRFLSCFTATGLVDDWGNRYVGREEIKQWSDRELIGANGVLTVGPVTTEDNRLTFTGDWKSSFYSGPGRFTFVLEGPLVAEWHISG